MKFCVFISFKDDCIFFFYGRIDQERKKEMQNEENKEFDFDMVGKTFQLYPSDTYEKFVEVLKIDDHGVWFKIVKADSRACYKEGDILFISHNNVLTLKLVK